MNDGNLIVRLAASGVDLNSRNHQGITAVHAAAFRENIDALDVLLNLGADPNLGNQLNYTPLMAACTNRKAKAVKLLLKQGADPNAGDVEGQTALISVFATSGPDYETQIPVAQALLDAGAEINCTDACGATPLMHAAWFGSLIGVQWLIQHGATVGARDKAGRTAKDIAIAKEFYEIAILL